MSQRAERAHSDNESGMRALLEDQLTKEKAERRNVEQLLRVIEMIICMILLYISQLLQRHE